MVVLLSRGGDVPNELRIIFNERLFISLGEVSTFSLISSHLHLIMFSIMLAS